MNDTKDNVIAIIVAIIAITLSIFIILYIKTT